LTDGKQAHGSDAQLIPCADRKSDSTGHHADMISTGQPHMTKNDQKHLSETFRKMHHGPRLLLLPNAWDAMSARIFEAAGFPAVATTSGGLAWSLGFPDGEHAPWSEVVAATERIVRTVRVPVTADIEGGYGETPERVARSVAEIIRAGVVGINLEDSTPVTNMPVRSIEDSVARIRAARQAAQAADVPIVINARIDLYLKNVGDDATRFADTVRRGKAYMAAGADCLFPFGLTDPKIIAELVKALNAPINIVGRAGGPGVAELERLGIARISTASGPSLVIMSLTKQIAEELRTQGQFDVLKSSMKRPDVQQLFAVRSK
jgi:2-methylisocitrate lyase-like PEP mutase family enzyme